MKRNLYLILIFLLMACEGKSQMNKKSTLLLDSIRHETNNTITQFIDNNKDNGKSSQSLGTVSNGKLINGKLMPFQGENFRYFDTTSYLSSRAFVNDKVKKATLDTYKELKKEFSQRQFCIMECSNEDGGKIFPHRTHQNGLSIDFMMPLIKDGKPFYGLDTIGSSHYWLGFDNSGKYDGDNSISIDLNLVAYHILKLKEQSNKNGLRISKVIIKTEMIDDLYSTQYGKILKNSGIYIAQKLNPLINSLHDDHYHIDFEIIK